MDLLVLGGKKFRSRLLTGTGKFSRNSLISDMLKESGSEIITVALRRVNLKNPEDNILSYISKEVTLLPNTSGARNASEAVNIARIARDAGCGNFIKIEIINDMKYLMPDNAETLLAAKILSSEDFIVLPYISPDLITAKKLEDAGAAAVMPLGSPIGSHQGLKAKNLIEIIIDCANVPVIVDAGIGKPSHAAEAMEMGADAVLINSAIACAEDPALMGRAFKKAVEAGRECFLAKAKEESKYAEATSPLTGFLFN